MKKRIILLSCVLMLVLGVVLYKREQKLFSDFAKENLYFVFTGSAIFEYQSVQVGINVNTVADKGAASNFYGDLTMPSREYYFGEIDPALEPLIVNVPGKGVLKIYPYAENEEDKNSKIVVFQKENCFTRKYLLTGFGDFDRLLDAVYAMTENEAFLTEQAVETE